MPAEFDLLHIVAGLGLFLFGMSELERGLERLAGRSFKRFLRTHTRNRFEAVLSGTLITALLQSSSVVSLMVLAFVGAGILEFRNALGIIVGANLGSTFTGWIVATIGFKVDIEGYAFTLAGAGAMLAFFAARASRLRGYGRIVLGFGLLFVGLAAMKSGAEAASTALDFSAFAAYPAIVHAVIGVALTAIVHSSAAVIVLALSSLAANVITLDAAVCIAIGADLGTTITAVVGAIKGSPGKKRVAAAQVLFNLGSAIVAFTFRAPMLKFLQEIAGIQDPLYTLVAFHSSFNFLGIAIVLPVFDRFAKFIEKLFAEPEEFYSGFIVKVPHNVPEAAVEAIATEARDFFAQAVNLSLTAFGFPPHTTARPGAAFADGRSYAEAYRAVKHLEGEILNYAVLVQRGHVDPDEQTALDQALGAIREAMHGAKCIKDIAGDVEASTASDDDVSRSWYLQLGMTFRSFAIDLYEATQESDAAERFRRLAAMPDRNRRDYDDFVKSVYAAALDKRIDEAELSTRLNVNREIYSSKLSLFLAAKDAFLSPQQAADLGNLPALHV